MLQRVAAMVLLTALFLSPAAMAQSYPSPAAPAQPSQPATKASAKVRTVAIVLREFKFVPNAITLKVGQPVALRLTNQGTMEHEFISPDLFRGALSVAVSGGEFEEGEVHVARDATVTVRLTPTRTGTFRFWCAEKYRGKLHRDLGMRGVINVTR
ncbi:MAG: cupredoxin domain-containing protein [Armatimonadota bacterium]